MAEHTTTTTVYEKIWAIGDTYLEVSVQVFESEGFKKGDKVIVKVQQAD